MKKILFITLHRGVSSNDKYYNDQEIGLAKAFTKLGFDSTVIKSATDINDIREKNAGSMKMVYVPVRAFGVHCIFDWSIIKKYAPDIVQINADNQFFVPDLACFLEKNNIPFYFYIGSIYSNNGSNLKKSLMRMLLKRNIASYKKYKCFAKNPALAIDLEKQGVKDVTVAPVGLDTDVITRVSVEKKIVREKLDLPADKKILLYIGRLEENKNPLQALVLLSKLNESYVLVMVGTGSMENLIGSEIEKLGLKDRIIRIERVSNKDIQEYYRACDYFVNFSQTEIFGMSILEAMYQGSTVLALHAPGPDFIIEDKKSGFLTDNIDEMIEIIASDRRIRPEEAENRIEENFLWNRTAEIIYNGHIRGVYCN